MAGRKTPALAAPYFFLGIIALRFVGTCEGQQLTSKKAERELAHFEDYAAKLGGSFTRREESEKLEVLNSVANDFFDRSK